MSGTDIQGSKMVELYHRYVGEPASRRDVYGYWVFVLGGIVGLVGVLVYQFEQALFTSNLAVREIAIILAAMGLPLALLGIIVLLPVRRRGMQASIVGVGISLVAVYLFTHVYPGLWYVGDPDYSPHIIGLYTVGIAVLAAVAMLVPIITGEKGLLVEPDVGIGRDNPPLLIGDANRDAIFAVFKTRTHDWTWRVIQREAVAESAQRATTDTDARLYVEDVRPRLGQAGLLEITTAAFRLYRTETGGWRWTLVREDGSVLATNEHDYPDRDGVEESVSFLKEAGPDAGVLDIRSAAFDVYDRDDRWYWRLLNDRREEIARTSESFTSESNATTATNRFVDTLTDARLLGIDTVAMELMADDAGWRWRIITADDQPLATSDAAFDSRREAETAATTASERLQGATVVDVDTPGYELYERNGRWSWRLRSGTDEIVAHAHADADRVEVIRSGAERTRERVAEADVIEYELADYEIYPDGDRWRWRLVTADRTVVADSAESYEDAEAAEAAADRVREQALAADLIEFEHAAFQQYESEGEWRWRLIDEDGSVMADSGEEYASKADVMGAMTTLKENAPNAKVLEIDTAAFEIFRSEDGAYAWRLIDETGQLVAAGIGVHETRSSAREDVEFVRSTAESAAVRSMPRAAFQIHTAAEEEWRWRLIDPAGTVLADGPTGYPTRDDATASIAEVRTTGAEASIDALGPVSVQLRRNGNWHWRLVDPDREPIAVGERIYEERADAVADVEAVTAHAGDAPIFELGDGVVWIDRTQTTDGSWSWRLVDGDRIVVAHSDRTYETRDAAVEAVETVRARASDAELIAFEGAVFELYRDDESAWRWRLLAEDETVMATSEVGYDRRRDVEATIADVREVATDASILEIDEAAYELHRRDGGWVWRLVDENGTTLVESVTVHATRKEARDEMNEIKQYAPDGQITVTR